MSDWLLVCKDSDLALRQARVVAGSDVQVAVFRGEDGRCYAVEDRCPHRGARLSNGAVYDVDKVACADHGWTICLADGQVLPPDQGCVRTYPVKVEDGLIYVQVATDQ
jgi:nitrite reductase (NADH) small subunit